LEFGFGSLANGAQAALRRQHSVVLLGREPEASEISTHSVDALLGSVLRVVLRVGTGSGVVGGR
jgi:hypothetical protein